MVKVLLEIPDKVHKKAKLIAVAKEVNLYDLLAGLIIEGLNKYNDKNSS